MRDVRLIFRNSLAYVELAANAVSDMTPVFFFGVEAELWDVAHTSLEHGRRYNEDVIDNFEIRTMAKLLSGVFETHLRVLARTVQQFGRMLAGMKVW